MIVKNRSAFGLGAGLLVGFFVVLFLMFLPIYGKEKENFLAFSDRSFNRLAKGSAYFIPALKKELESFPSTEIAVKIQAKRSNETPEVVENRIRLMTKLLEKAQVQYEVVGSEVHIKGDLKNLLKEALEDSDYMYWNKGEAVRNKYGVEDEKRLFRQWHTMLGQIQKDLALNKRVVEAKFTNSVLTRAIEPAYNFYRIEPQKLSEQAFMLTALLIFYIIYTMWFGYSILLLFEGLGLSTKKAKVKKEV